MTLLSKQGKGVQSAKHSWHGLVKPPPGAEIFQPKGAGNKAMPPSISKNIAYVPEVVNREPPRPQIVEAWHDRILPSPPRTYA